jgi:hypothetical protein
MVRAMRNVKNVRKALLAGEVSGLQILGGIDAEGIATAPADHEAGLLAVYEGEQIPSYEQRLKDAYKAQQEMLELGSRLEVKGEIPLGATIKS